LENKTGYVKPEIPDWFKHKYHNYHRALYTTEYHKTLGIHGDKPNQKFGLTQVPGKLFRDNLDVEAGTTRASNNIPGYSGKLVNVNNLGFMSVNHVPKKNDMLNDPYFNLGKTNHLLNYNTRVVGYEGSRPSNQVNIKGNIRPYCLSTEGESFK
jgi:hypothetical protein